MVAVLPLRLLASNAFCKWGTGILCAIGILRLAQGMIEDWNSPIEPNTPAIALRAFSLGILLSSLYLIWRTATPGDQTSRN